MQRPAQLLSITTVGDIWSPRSKLISRLYQIMPGKAVYETDAERKEARKASRLLWYRNNRESELAKMRNRYDRKVAIPLDRDRRHQTPQPSQPVHSANKRLVQRNIRRLRQMDDILRGGSVDGNLTTYGAEIYAEYRSKEREEGLLMLLDLERDITTQLSNVDSGLETIRKEVGLLDPIWKEGNLIRSRYARALGYVEDMRQAAELKKLKVRYKARQLLYQQELDA